MAVIDIDSNATFSFDSTDTVTWKTGGDIGDGNNVTKTDLLKMIIGIDAGITNIISGTGFIDIKAQRDEFVHLQSNVAEPSMGDFLWFVFTGTSNSNTMQWCVVANATFGLNFQGHTPAANKFRYMVLYNCASGGIVDASSSGTTVMNDILVVHSNETIQKTGAATGTYNRITTHFAGTTPFAAVTKTTAFNDIFIMQGGNITANFVPASGQIVTIDNMYVDDPSKQGGRDFKVGGAGTLTITNLIKRGGASGILFQAAGTLNLTNSDFTDANLNGIAGTSGTINVISCYIAGNEDNDHSVVDTSTTTPSDKQHLGITGVLETPRSTANSERSFSSLSDASIGENGFTAIGTSDIVCKCRVLFGTATGIYTMSTEFDAPSLRIDEINFTVESVVTDWNLLGRKFDVSKSIALVNLKPGTQYFWILEGVDPFGQKFQSAEQTTTTLGVDTTDPTWDDGGPGTDSGLTAVDAATNGDVNLSWNTPLDETDIEGVQLFFSSVSEAQAIIDGVKRIIPDNITSIKLSGLTNDIEHFFIVRALDKAGNTTSETTAVTATPTGVGVPIPVPGAIQSFLTAE